jgi:hypothetical protein
MKLRHLYLVLALIGLILPYSQFASWIVGHHAMNIPLFIRDMFANQISAFFAMDVIVSAIVLIVFILNEGRRLGVRTLWLPVIATLLVGVSLGLPLFLYLRQIQLHESRI